MVDKAQKAVIARAWFAQWPVGTRAVLSGSYIHHVVVVGHEIGATGWPVLKLEEEITGHTYYCFYGQRRYLEARLQR